MQNKAIVTGLLIISVSGFLFAGWVQKHSGTNTLYDIDFPPNNVTTGFACGANSFVLRTMDGGESWDQLTRIEPSGTFRAICFPVNESIGYIACDEGNVQITRDGGERWELINTGVRENLTGIFFIDTDCGYVAGARGIVFSTRSAGQSWDAMFVPTHIDLYGLYFLSFEKGYVVGDSGFIAFTRDGGQNWEVQNSRVTTRLYAIHMIDENFGWVVGANRTCLKTEDGGNSWEAVAITALPATVEFRALIFPIDRETGFICGNQGRIARTTDSGNSWTTFNLLYNLYGMDFPADNLIGWVCGQNEVIFKTDDGGAIEETNLSSEVKKNVLTVSPNPFRLNTKIRFANPKNIKDDLRIYDRAGSLVRTLTLNEKGSTNWDGRNELNQRITAGVYLLEYKTNTGSKEHFKLTVLK